MTSPARERVPFHTEETYCGAGTVTVAVHDETGAAPAVMVTRPL